MYKFITYKFERQIFSSVCTSSGKGILQAGKGCWLVAWLDSSAPLPIPPTYTHPANMFPSPQGEQAVDFFPPKKKFSPFVRVSKWTHASTHTHTRARARARAHTHKPTPTQTHTCMHPHTCTLVVNGVVCLKKGLDRSRCRRCPLWREVRVAEAESSLVRR